MRPEGEARGERTRYDLGAFCWVGLATFAAAKAFYGSPFGWEAEDLEAGAAGAYATLHRGGSEAAILYRQQPQARAVGAPPHRTSYIPVEDADATAARAEELGGAGVFRAPIDVLDAGRVAGADRGDVRSGYRCTGRWGRRRSRRSSMQSRAAGHPRARWPRFGGA